MASDAESLSARVQSSFTKLSAVASDLNAVSDELGKSITELDAALKKLNLGVTAWVQLRADDGLPEEPWYYNEELGYAKIAGKWGVALRIRSGDLQYPDHEKEEAWLFNDAPRTLRLAAIKKVAELLEQLSDEAAKTAEKVKSELAGAQEIAAAIKEAAEKPKVERVLLKRTEGQK